MIIPSDKDYTQTKRIKQGINFLNLDFMELAEWINNEYEVSVLNIYYEIDHSGHKSRPKVEIIFEHKEDEMKFREGRLGNYHVDEQRKIAAKFNQLVASGKKGKYDARDLFVYFSSFAPVALMEANNAIPTSDILRLKEEIGNPEIWHISKDLTATFFFFTRQQSEAAKSSGYIHELSDKYFRVLNKYDEFGYLDKQTFSVRVDSKEVFDSQYQSNWFYYYK